MSYPDPETDPVEALRRTVIDALLESGCDWTDATGQIASILTAMVAQCEDEAERRDMGIS